MPFGFDVVLLDDNSLRLIESNPGGNSSFLFEYQGSVWALNNLLKNYPTLVQKHAVIGEGMNAQEQLLFIKKFFQRHAIDFKKHYPGMVLSSKEIKDLEFKQKLCNKALLSQ